MVLQLPFDHAHIVVQMTMPMCQGPGTGNVVKAKRLALSPYPEFQKRNVSQEWGLKYFYNNFYTVS